MAPIPASISVNFISNYAGPHRVCWRIGGVGPYDCTTIVVCAGGGNPCAALIPILVDNETCDTVLFDGYVQAACELEASLNGRIPFNTSFVPVPPCHEWYVTCNAVNIPTYNVLTPGSGYIVGSLPALTILGGGGSFAAANGVVGDGGLKTFTITNGGAAYNGGGSATFTNVPAQNIVGAGVGGTLDVTVTLGVITGVVVSAAPVTSPGTGYLVTDTFDFNNAFLGGTGAGAIITVATTNTGEIQYINVTNTGAAYSSVPTTTIAPPPAGVTATVSPNMGDCPQFDFESDCDGNVIGFVPPRPLGFVYKKCSPTAPTPSADWIVTEVGCCYDCRDVIFTAIPGPIIPVRYTDCLTGALITVAVNPALPPVNVCAVNNSWFWIPTASVTATVGLVCP
jgi:hypothetical protein